MQTRWPRNPLDSVLANRPLYAFCATLGYSRASYVEFVTDMKVGTLIDCHAANITL